MSRILHKSGVPVAADFASTDGAPLVVNDDTGEVYAISTAGVVASVAGSGGVSDGDKGDITVSASGATWTIDNGAVSYAKTTGVAASSHNHAASDTTSGAFDIARIPTGTTSSTACIGNDARLSDARTPLTHSHSAGDLPALNNLTAPSGSVNFNDQQATSFRIENRTDEPSAPTVGQIWLRTNL
jgi:hypothetical protein